MNLEDKKDRVAQIKGYPNWKDFYNWVSGEREKPEVVAQQIESAMEEVIKLNQTNK